MSAAQPTVFSVDDDAALLRALARLLREAGLQCVGYTSAEEFPARHDAQAPGCLVLDVNLPGLDGLALQRSLAGAGPALPIVRAKRATTAKRQARAGENVPRIARPGLVECRWHSA